LLIGSEANIHYYLKSIQLNFQSNSIFFPNVDKIKKKGFKKLNILKELYAGKNQCKMKKLVEEKNRDWKLEKKIQPRKVCLGIF